MPRRVSPFAEFVRYLQTPTLRTTLFCLWTLLLANAIPLIAFLMGFRFWWREAATPEYRAQSRFIMVIAGLASAAITWLVLSRAWEAADSFR